MAEEVCANLLPSKLCLLQLLHFIHLCNLVYTNGYTGHIWIIILKAECSWL